MLLLLPTEVILKGPPAAILEISVASVQRRGKLCHSISIQSTCFVRRLSLENVKVFIFVSVTPLYSSGGPKIDAQSSPIFEISGYSEQSRISCVYLERLTLRWCRFVCYGIFRDSLDPRLSDRLRLLLNKQNMQCVIFPPPD